MDGLELLKRMRLEYPMVQTIIITGYVTLENLLAAMRYGAAGCIFKPLADMAELEAEVARAVERLNTWQQKLKALMGMKPEENPS